MDGGGKITAMNVPKNRKWGLGVKKKGGHKSKKSDQNMRKRGKRAKCSDTRSRRSGGTKTLDELHWRLVLLKKKVGDAK